jgi:protein SCO1/2
MTPQLRHGGSIQSACAGVARVKLLWIAAGLGLCIGVTGVLFWRNLAAQSRQSPQPDRVHTYAARGTIQKVETPQQTLVIAHQAIPSYMDAMTMPFKVRQPQELKGLQAGDQITFRLSVTETESWIDNIVKFGTGAIVQAASTLPVTPGVTAPSTHHPLLDYAFTNELGQAVSLHSFAGQALAITFFFTRCPLPEFCPRLSKNFAEASRRLNSMTNAPPNWHFLSVTFDPEFDNPTVLKAYGEKYNYDSNHWSFITGPKDKIAELARMSNVQFEPDGGFFNHNFRTMIIDASGHLQMVFPTGGDLSEAIVSEMLKAAGAGKNKPS